MLFVGPPVKRVDYIRVWVFSSIAIDQVYWTAARILTFTSGDWYKWEFEHDVIVLFLKGNFMASMLVLIFYYVFVEYVHKKKI